LPPTGGQYVSQVAQAEYSPWADGFAGPVACDTLVRHAVANNPEIQAARYHARAQQARIPQAASLADPTLMTTVFLESIETAAGPQEVAMSLSQRFPWFGKRELRGTVAQHQAMAACARLAAVELEVIERVKRAYFDLYFFQKAIEETRKLEPRLADVVAVARAKYQTSIPGAGLETVLQAQVELAGLKTRLVQLERGRTEARARLASVLHLPSQTRLEPQLSIRRREVAHTVDVLAGLVESCQPELDAIRREVCRDRSATALACRDYWPDMTLSFNWHEIGSEGLSAVATGEDAYSLGVGVNLPIYRKRLDAAVREARNNAARSARNYAAQHDKLRAEVETLYARFHEQHEVLRILETEILPAAEQTFELAGQGYRQGRVEFQQLIDIYRSLLEYRVDLHRRESAREQLIASLERAVGCAVTSTGVD
jgi:outer membrane protein TolC